MATPATTGTAAAAAAAAASEGDAAAILEVEIPSVITIVPVFAAEAGLTAAAGGTTGAGVIAAG
jgi:hypothetical protein